MSPASNQRALAALTMKTLLCALSTLTDKLVTRRLSVAHHPADHVDLLGKQQGVLAAAIRPTARRAPTLADLQLPESLRAVASNTLAT